ncbi:hypothetical protein DMB66_11510 [Actinoplanes sp. ATCC 53533]|uniref:hypothetical protein n=1 Tax=Actinoplanes sp. ATCC 53533 TaxID=1288362 RepID=UPI000F788112|nr:hypothetical protein [Actinoplanes sp. ATCC 53533]RSM69606.1 hypothetical protein DMB66_11510 [Actinoplanes sp. ATCC 53533]
MRLAHRCEDPDCTTAAQTVIVVMTVLLIVSWVVLRMSRVEEHAAARERHQPSVVVQLGDDPSGPGVAPGCGTPQPGAGPPVFATEPGSGSCILIWVP